MDVIFDAHSTPPRAINPRFHRHHRTIDQRSIRGLRQSRRFVHFQADAMAEAVTEQFTEAAVLNVAPRETIGIPPGHPRANGTHRALVGLTDDIVELALFVRGAPNDE